MKCWAAEHPAETNQLYVDLGANRAARAIAAGGTTTCAILDDGAVTCWRTLLSDILHDPLKGSGVRPEDVDLGAGRRAVAIAGGEAGICAVLDTSEVKCWGDLTRPCHDLWNRGKSPELRDALAPVPLGGEHHRARAISVGDRSACAIVDDGSLRCWGYAYSESNVGTSAEYPMCAPQGAVPLGEGRSALLVANGFAYTCAVLDNEELKCWGAQGPWLGVSGYSADTSAAFLPAIDVGH